LFAGVDFSLAAGEWLHVQGENGAGKTTLLRALVGLTPPLAGEIRWQGQPVGELGEAWRRTLLYLGHLGALKEELTPLENLRCMTALDGDAASERDLIAALVRFGLRGREELPARVLSAGQKRRVLLARMALGRAPLWVLDEPFTALDVKAVDLLCSVIDEHLQTGGLAILTSHQSLPLAGGRTIRL